MPLGSHKRAAMIVSVVFLVASACGRAVAPCDDVGPACRRPTADAGADVSASVVCPPAGQVHRRYGFFVSCGGGRFGIARAADERVSCADVCGAEGLTCLGVGGQTNFQTCPAVDAGPGTLHPCDRRWELDWTLECRCACR
jgi:hypothetical protein